MAVSGYFFRAFFVLLLMVSFGKNATAAGYFDDLTAEERAFIEQEQREQEERELHAAMAASHHDHAAKNAARERLQIEMALAADAHAQQLKQEADDLERALALSRETHPAPYSASSSAFAHTDPRHQAFSSSSSVDDHATEEDEELAAALALSMKSNVPAAAAVAPPQLSERELRMERMKHFQAPSVVRSIDEQVESTFEREKREIENEIHRLESINLMTAYPKPQDRPNARREIDARLTELRSNLQNYTQLGKITATKLRLKSYISSQQKK
ncbi:MAG: hypothetical protein WCJ92_05400 [Alphaproteobacteria bacterium]